jgi:hypothetical protein
MQSSMSTALKTKQGVIDLMKSSQNRVEWNANCLAVKLANQGNPEYPRMFVESVVESRIAGAVISSFGDPS